MSKRIGLSPAATMERLRKGEPTWFVSAPTPTDCRASVMQFPLDWYKSMIEAEDEGWESPLKILRTDSKSGHMNFATLEEAERYAARLRGKDKP